MKTDIKHLGPRSIDIQTDLPTNPPRRISSLGRKRQGQVYEHWIMSLKYQNGTLFTEGIRERMPDASRDGSVYHKLIIPIFMAASFYQRKCIRVSLTAMILDTISHMSVVSGKRFI